jgi:hypothetical protein
VCHRPRVRQACAMQSSSRYLTALCVCAPCSTSDSHWVCDCWLWIGLPFNHCPSRNQLVLELVTVPRGEFQTQTLCDSQINCE